MVAVEFAVYHEGWRLRERLIRQATTGWWIGDPDPDATFVLVWLLFAPFCFLFPLSLSEITRWWPGRRWRELTALSRTWATWVMLAVVSVTSLSMSWAVSRSGVPTVPEKTFHDLGPYIHDEFSYRFQAETYLAGRLWWPGVPRARELFHQMHVLNEDHFASRYFPATGAWLAPFVALGFPVGASWLAGMLIANLAALITQRSHGTAAGFLAGMLIAVAPGNTLINNMLLAHGPTLTGLMLCLYGFHRLFDAIDWRWAGLAGAGLALAMLSRPLTAASVALPFGIWWFWTGYQRHSAADIANRSAWWRGTIAMGVPLLAGFAIMAWQNQAITGKMTLTPYSLYNHLYTPRHVFGFHEGNALATPPPNRHLKEFDEWAQPLTWTLAFENLRTRLRDSLGWSLGAVPLGMAGLYFLLHGQKQSRYDCLLMASIVSVHIAHMPYWLSGLLGYHYVFESGVLWLMLFAGVVVRMVRTVVAEGRLLAPLWITGLVGLSIAVNFLPIAPGTTVPRVMTGIRNIAHVADRYERFVATLASSAIARPAVVLVKLSAADLHAEYVRNRPPFDGPVLVGRYRPDIYSDEDLRRIFPERHLYVYDTDSGDVHAIGAPREAAPSANEERVP